MAGQENYIEYKGLPLVREGDSFCYGDIKEKYVLLLNVLSKKPDGEPDMILITICPTHDRTKVVKQGFKNGLFEALDFGSVWLEQIIKEN